MLRSFFFFHVDMRIAAILIYLFFVSSRNSKIYRWCGYWLWNWLETSMILWLTCKMNQAKTRRPWRVFQSSGVNSQRHGIGRVLIKQHAIIAHVRNNDRFYDSLFSRYRSTINSYIRNVTMILTELILMKFESLHRCETSWIFRSS